MSHNGHSRLQPKQDMCSFLLANVITRYELDVTLTPKRWRDLKSAVLRMSEKTAEYGTRSI
jgi:hypothetical protein